jgi:hypothetical protein
MSSLDGLDMMFFNYCHTFDIQVSHFLASNKILSQEYELNFEENCSRESFSIFAIEAGFQEFITSNTRFSVNGLL